MKTEGCPKPVRMIFAARLTKRSGLQQAHLFNHVQQQVRDLIDPIRPLGRQPSDVDLGEVGVGAALRCRYPDLGRRRLVVELDPEALQ